MLSVWIPVALLFGQDDVSGRNIGEESDGRLFSACLAVFIQGMVVIIHLVGNEVIRVRVDVLSHLEWLLYCMTVTVNV